MANRYWVGGTASWDATAGSKWSLTSGGAGGQAVPISGLDDVFFDAVPGAVTVTLSGSPGCKSITCTGFTGTLTGAVTLDVVGNVTLSSGGTYTGLRLNMSSAAKAISLVGKTITSLVCVAATTITSASGAMGALNVNCTAGVIVSLVDALTVTGAFTLTGGTFDASNQNLSIGSLVPVAGETKVVTMGSGIWFLSGTGTVWDGSLLTVTPGTSTINIFDASSATKTFAGGSKTYANLLLTGSGSGAFIITGSNTFTSFGASNPPHTIRFESGATTQVTSFDLAGTALGGLMTLEPTGTAHWNLTSTAGFSRAYLSLRGSHAHGGTFTATNSFDAGDNFNWDFARSSSTDIYFDSAYQYNGSATATLTGLNWLIGETVGVVADGVDIGDATVSSAGNLTLPSGTGSIVTVGKRYNSRAVTLRAPQTGNQDGASLGRQMNIKNAAADILDTPYLKVGTLTGTEIIPPSWRGGVTGDGGTGLYEIPIDDSYMNEGVIVFESDKGYPAVVRAVRFSIESEP